MNQTLSSDPHLTDVELIDLGSGVDTADAGRLLAHLDACRTCAEGLESIRLRVDAAWSDPIAIERREARIGRPQIMRGEREQPWWTNAVGWASLRPLRVGLAAMAEGSGADLLEFDVLDEDRPAPGLSGVLQRRGSAYYLCITLTNEARAAMTGKRVEVVAVDRSLGRVLFERTVKLDEFTLLGTDLRIDLQQITARLVH